MAKRKRKLEPTQLDRIESFLDRIAPDIIKRLEEAEAEARNYAINYTVLSDKLVKLLSPQQLEAAQYSGIAPEVYAANLLELLLEGSVTAALIKGMPVITNLPDLSVRTPQTAV